MARKREGTGNYCSTGTSFILEWWKNFGNRQWWWLPNTANILFFFFYIFMTLIFYFTSPLQWSAWVDMMEANKTLVIRVCSHRTYRSPRAAGPLVPSVPGHLPHHHGGQPWTDFSHLEGPPSSHPHVLIPGKLGLCRRLFFIFCDS